MGQAGAIEVVEHRIIAQNLPHHRVGHYLAEPEIVPAAPKEASLNFTGVKGKKNLSLFFVLK